MRRYIDANALIDRMKKDPLFPLVERYGVTGVIEAEPTADVVERKKGKWIEYVNSHCECPFCHKEWSFFENMTEWFNFCPNCGAEMEEEE